MNEMNFAHSSTSNINIVLNKNIKLHANNKNGIQISCSCMLHLEDFHKFIQFKVKQIFAKN